MVEDLEIILDDGTRQCRTWECPDYKIVEPLSWCVWKETYLNNVNGLGTTFDPKAPPACAECDGFDDECKNYVREEE